MPQPDLTEAVDAAARDTYTHTVGAADGTEWDTAPKIVKARFRVGVLPVVAAAAPLIYDQGRRDALPTTGTIHPAGLCDCPDDTPVVEIHVNVPGYPPLHLERAHLKEVAR